MADQPRIPKLRLDALTDGVFAVAMTLDQPLRWLLLRRNAAQATESAAQTLSRRKQHE